MAKDLNRGEFLKKIKITAVIFSLLTITNSASRAEGFKSPDILILGDSQLTFGMGRAFHDFFKNIKTHCSPTSTQKRNLKKLGSMSVNVIGVRSSSLQTWSARGGKAKAKMCKVDPNWKINARVYGGRGQNKGIYVQIGEGAAYNFCQRRKSAFEAMFSEDYYNPKLLIMSFLGNSDKRWAENKAKAKRDIQKTMQQLPPNLPCIFMTTAPVFKKKTIDLRLRAQKNAKEAFRETGSRCTFIEGLTPNTVGASLGNKKHFRLNESGSVKDPFHPNKAAARNFFSIKKKNICNAIFNQLANK